MRKLLGGTETILLMLLFASVPVDAASVGAWVGGEIKVNQTQSGSHSSLALAPDGKFAVGWNSAAADTSGSTALIRVYGADGMPITDPFPVDSNKSGHHLVQPGLAWRPDETLVVVWLDDATNGNVGIKGRLFEKDGTPLGNVFTVISGDAQSFSPQVSADATGRFLVTWAGSDPAGTGNAVLTRRFSANAVPLTDINAVERHDEAHFLSPRIAMSPSGRYVVMWQHWEIPTDAHLPSDIGLRARVFDDGGNAVGSRFDVNEIEVLEQAWFDIAMHVDGRIVAVWENRYGDLSYLEFNSEGMTTDRASSVTFSGAARSPRLSVDMTGNTAFAWVGCCKYSGTREAYMKIVDPYGYTLEGEHRVNMFTSEDEVSARIGLDADGDVVAVFERHSSDGSIDTVAQRMQGPADVDIVLSATTEADEVNVGESITIDIAVENRHSVIAPTGFGIIDRAVGAATGLSLQVDLSDARLKYEGISDDGWRCTEETGSSGEKLLACRRQDMLPAGETARTSLTLSATSNIEHKLTLTVSARENDPFDLDNATTIHLDKPAPTQSNTTEPTSSGGGGGASTILLLFLFWLFPRALGRRRIHVT